MHFDTPLPSPTPALGQSFYEQNLNLRLEYSAAARDNYANYISSNRREILPSYRPIKLDVEPISRCNFKCTMCVVSTWEKGKRSDDLTLESFQSILQSEPQVVELKLQGLGEPLMLGEPLFEMINFARRQFIWVRTTTNASRLHINENYRKLIDSRICEVQVSIDGATEKTFEAIRNGSKAKRVFENCQILNSYAAGSGWNCTKMWTVVQSANVGELEALVDTAFNLGFTSQCFAIDLHGWGLEEWNEKNKRSESTMNSLSSQRLLNLVEYGQNKGIKVEFWQNSTKYSTSSPEKLCPWPFERTMISSDKRVTPCCMISNPDTFEIGKGYSSNIWASVEYQDFRTKHLNGDIPEACRMCYDE